MSNSPTSDQKKPFAEGEAPSLPKSASTESNDSATARRAAWQRSASTPISPTAGSHGRLDRQASQTSTRQRRPSYRRQSSFDLPHINSFPSRPDFKHLEELKLGEVPWWTSQRLLLSIICFFGFISLYAQRVNLSIAMVAMVDHSWVESQKNSSLGQNSSMHYSSSNATGVLFSSTTSAESHASPDGEIVCPELTKSATPGEFKWSKDTQGLLLGAFFWGYLILQVPGGRVSERLGAKKVIAICMFPVAILNILSPVAARASPYLFMVVRILVGLGEGVMYPAAQALWSRWAPPNERSRLIGFSYAGGQFGNAIIFPIAGYLCAYGFDGGWASVFYIVGAMSFIWCVVWVIFATDSPDQNRWISDVEKKYIKASIGERGKVKKGSAIPWKSIFTSKAMWGIIIAHCCGNYGAYMLLTQIPTYMKEVLKFDIKSNGVFSMLPYLTFWFFITVSGMLADLLISKEILSIGWTRKLMASIGMIGPGAFLIGTGFMECTQQTEAVVMLTIAVGLCGFHFSGYFINHGDIAPAYAGTLFGITNTAATVPGIIAPYVVAALTPNGARTEWQTAFYVAAAIYFIGALCYVILGDGEVQPWAECGAGESDDTMNPDEEDQMGVGFGLHEITEKVEEVDEDEEEAKATEKMLDNGDTNNTVKA